MNLCLRGASCFHPGKRHRPISFNRTALERLVDRRASDAQQLHQLGDRVVAGPVRAPSDRDDVTTPFQWKMFWVVDLFWRTQILIAEDSTKPAVFRRRATDLGRKEAN